MRDLVRTDPIAYPNRLPAESFAEYLRLIQAAVTDLETSVTALQSDLTALEARVTALETP